MWLVLRAHSLFHLYQLYNCNTAGCGWCYVRTAPAKQNAYANCEIHYSSYLCCHCPIALDICAGMAFTPLPFPLGMVCAVVVFGRLPLTVTTDHAADARSMPPLLTCAAAWHLLRYSTAISS